MVEHMTLGKERSGLKKLMKLRVFWGGALEGGALCLFVCFKYHAEILYSAFNVLFKQVR